MAKGTNLLAKVGSWAFIFGVVIALVVGLLNFKNNAWTAGALLILGLIVGFLNVTGRETTPFLLATVSLMIVANFGAAIFVDYGSLGEYMKNILQALMTFVLPATIIVALKAIYALAHDE